MHIINCVMEVKEGITQNKETILFFRTNTSSFYVYSVCINIIVYTHNLVKLEYVWCKDWINFNILSGYIKGKYSSSVLG
jgi:hypothetical protein